MAKFRMAPREGSRHTGRLFDRGFQYHNPSRDSIELGPWSRIAPLGTRQLGQDVLESLEDGILRDGIIYPIWHRAQSTDENEAVVGAFELPVISGELHAKFYKDIADSDELKVYYDDGSSTGTLSTGLTSSDEEVSAAAYQDDVYYSHSGLSNVRKWDFSDGTEAAVADSPAGAMFVFFLDNNLLAIYQSGDTYMLEWSVDSDPSDWSSTGAGSAPLPGSLGEPRGVGYILDSAYIVGSKGILRITPTGIATPAFQLTRIESVDACAYDRAVATGPNEIYYINYRQRVVRFDGRTSRIAGTDEEIWKGTPRLYYSPRLRLLVVSSDDPAITLFLDPEVNAWVGNLDLTFRFVADGPTTTEIGKLVAYTNSGNDVTEYVLDLDPDVYVTAPKATTGRYLFHDGIWIDYIDLIRTDTGEPVPGITVTRQVSEGGTDTDTFVGASTEAVEEKLTLVRYFINNYAEGFDIAITVNAIDGPFDSDNLNAAGNCDVDAANPAGSYPADKTLRGNADIDSAAIRWQGDSINASGNLVLTAVTGSAEDLWTENTGIEQIRIPIRKVGKGAITAT